VNAELRVNFAQEMNMIRPDFQFDDRGLKFLNSLVDDLFLNARPRR
jgi:hypothetical protein